MNGANPPATFGSWNFNAAARHISTCGWLPRRSPGDQGVDSGTGCRKNGPTSSLTQIPSNALATCSPAPPSTSLTAARVRPQALGDLLHQTFVAKPRGRQGVSTHRARRLAQAGPRTRPLLGCPRTTASHRGRGHRSGRLPDGPPDPPSLVAVPSHLRRHRTEFSHRRAATDSPPGSPTGRQPDRESAPPQGPPTTTPVQPRRTCRWLRPRE